MAWVILGYALFAYVGIWVIVDRICNCIEKCAEVKYGQPKIVWGNTKDTTTDKSVGFIK